MAEETGQVRDTSVHGNRYDTGPVVAVAVAGKTAAWCGGIFMGDRDVIVQAQLAADCALPVNIYGHDLEAGGDTPLSALAALASFSPGRVIITEAPADVLEVFDQPHGVFVDLPPTTQENPVPDQKDN